MPAVRTSPPARPRPAAWLAFAALALAFGLLLGGAGPTPVRATPYFWDTAFRAQWRADEAAAPGFWGPLDTSTARIEPYQGHQTGAYLCAVDPPHPPNITIACPAAATTGRTSQYFDKGRMETNILGYMEGGPADVLTNGPLVVELKTGQLQRGDAIFEARIPAALPLAGDPGNTGPTYADLDALPERDRDTGTTAPLPTFNATTRQWERAGPLPASIPAAALAYTRVDDPTGTYGQNVLRAFADYTRRVPSGFAAIGWPVSPVFVLTVPVNQVPTTLLAQAFERRILTYDATRPAGRQVDSTHIGRDYYAWRYGANDPMRYGPPALVFPSPAPSTTPPTATARAA